MWYGSSYMYMRQHAILHMCTVERRRNLSTYLNDDSSTDVSTPM